MDDKKDILKLFLPKAVLKPANGIADRAVPDGSIHSGYVAIHEFPYRIGRESRGTIVQGRFMRTERPRSPGAAPNNDLYLIDPGPSLQVSREHCQIELRDGEFLLVDRGSTLGTVVGETRLGKHSGTMSAALRDGDTIRLGGPDSPYVYTFVCDLVA